MKVGRGGYILDMLGIILHYEAGFFFFLISNPQYMQIFSISSVFQRKISPYLLPGDSNSLAASFLELGREKSRVSCLECRLSCFHTHSSEPGMSKSRASLVQFLQRMTPSVSCMEGEKHIWLLGVGVGNEDLGST